MSTSSSSGRRDDPRPGPPARRGVTIVTEERTLPGRPLRLRLEDGREAVIDRRMVIGAASASDLVLDDPGVSGRHCVLWREDGRTLVSDCGSRNGTFLRGVRIDSGELGPGMALTVGRTRMHVTADEPDEPSLGMIGISRVMQRLRRRIERVAASRHPVLLLGESGTGKELAARAVHHQSRRRGAFVPVNCAALSMELAESELFGHERGAFTGAAGRRPGMFEEANGGTLFLDEIADLPLALQPKLLRVLETRMVRAVGASGERHIDVRVVAATHQDLRQAVAGRSFRLDLFHRLAAIEVRLPSLRERREDIGLLAQHFLDEIAEDGPRTFSPEALDVLRSHPWPGNVRELRHAIVGATLLGGAVLTPHDLFPDGEGERPPPVTTSSEGRRFSEIERDAILDALRRTDGKRRPAAAALGMPKSTFCDKVKRYGISL